MSQDNPADTAGSLASSQPGALIEAYERHRTAHSAAQPSGLEFGDCSFAPCRQFSPLDRARAEQRAAAIGYVATWPRPCLRPPFGWRCTRGFHVDGPCAAVPDGEPRATPIDAWSWTDVSGPGGGPAWWPAGATVPARGRIEGALRDAVAVLPMLTAIQRTYAEIAYKLAHHLDEFDDAEGSTGLAGVARELRAATAAIFEGVPVERSSDKLVADLGRPAA